MQNFLVTDNLPAQIELLVHRWGGSASEAVLEPHCQHFFAPNIEGFIGYRIERGCAIIYGDPICSVEDEPLLVQAFHKYCEEQGLNCIYIIASERFSKWAIQNVCSILIEVGEEYILDPFSDFKDGHKGFKLRNKENHAKKIGLTVHEYLYHSPNEDLKKSIENMSSNWTKGRKGAQISLGPINFFDGDADKRCFYLKDGSKVIGAALLSKLEAHQGWLLKFSITLSDAPRGSSELLIITILETLKNENCHYITYGMVPNERLGEIVGLGKLTTSMAKTAYLLAKWIFNLNHRRMYWDKFKPKTEPLYLLFTHSNLGIKEIKAVMDALTIS